MAHKRGLFIFEQDLRIEDNAALAHIAQSVETLDCVFVYDPKQHKNQAQFNCRHRGALPTLFLWQSLQELDKTLRQYGQNLKVIIGDPVPTLCDYVLTNNIDHIVKSTAYGVYEREQESRLFKAFETLEHDHDRHIHAEHIWQHTLFEPDQMPFTPDSMPDVFSKFRRKIENEFIYLVPPCVISVLPQPITKAIELPSSKDFGLEVESHPLAPKGGCLSGIAHLDDYFSIDALLTYKETRNGLDEWYSSSKVSFWLAHGCISAKQVSQRIVEFENTNSRNDSTYWLKFELLWREFFHWHLEKYQDKLFHFSGIANRKPLTTFNAQRFAQWCAGNTPFPIVNAAMKQLNETGYMSNRARQIVASCLVNELELDWRFGAAYFQQQLIDYDVAANWGNWQYIAGVGTDPRGARWFNITKQTEMYDPQRKFINKWQGHVTFPDIDQVDMVDWPISTPAMSHKMSKRSASDDSTNA